MMGDVEKGVREYIPFLEELEDGLYDSDGNLCEDLLVKRVEKDPRWTFQAGNQTIETLGILPLELPIPGKGNITCDPKEFGQSRETGLSAINPSGSH